jgi:hypothetical protein
MEELNHLNGPVMTFWLLRNDDIDTKISKYQTGETEKDRKLLKYYLQSKKAWLKEHLKIQRRIAQLNKELKTYP